MSPYFSIWGAIDKMKKEQQNNINFNRSCDVVLAEYVLDNC